jgi:rubrerythrin
MDREAPLEIAIANERAEAEFYRAAADRASGRAAAALFTMLADQELQHIALLEELQQHLAREGRWPERIADPGTVENIIETRARLRLLDAAAVDHDLDQVAALERAIDFERRAQRYYTALADAAASDPERVFFLTLAGLERDHRRWIEAFLGVVREDSGR